MKRLPLLCLLAVLAVAALAQSVKLDQDGKTVDITGDLSAPQVVTNIFPLAVSTGAPIKLPRLQLWRVSTQRVTALAFDGVPVSVTNGVDPNATWFLWFDNGVTNGLVPLTNGVIKP